MKRVEPKLFLLLTLVMLAAGLWDFGWAWPGRRISPYWPSLGISLVLIFKLGLAYLPAVLWGTFSAYVLLGLPLVTVASLSAISVLFPWLGYLWLKRLGYSSEVPRTRYAFQLMGIGALLLPLLASGPAALGLWWGGVAGEEPFGKVWHEVVLAMVGGTLLLAPFLFSFFQVGSGTWSTYKRLELGFLLVTTVLVTHWIFHQPYSFTFPISVVVLWSATRFQTRGNSAVQLIVGMVAAYYTVMGSGPFGDVDIRDRMVVFQTFIITITVVGIFLSTSMKAEALKQLKLDAERQRAELAERAKVEAALRESEQNFRLIADAMPNLTWTNYPDGKVTFVSRRWQDFTGIDPEQIENEFFSSILHPEDLQRCREQWQACLATGYSYQIEYRLRDRNGGFRWHLGRAVPIRDAQGKIVKWFGTATDIHDQKVAVEDLRTAKQELQESHLRLESAVAERTLDLKQALLEKELLLREIHHRVKNNLNIISSLLSLQSRQFDDGKLRLAFQESQNRINSIAVVHEKLYRSNHLGEVKFAGYIRQLVRNLLVTFGVNPDRIQVEVDAEDIELTVELAIPCGLIVNELVSNCLKHAFPNEASGRIKVRMNAVSLSSYELSVSDNGIGLEATVGPRKTASLGLQIVDTLARQLGGEISAGRKDGETRFSITFMGRGTGQTAAGKYDLLRNQLVGS